MKLTYRNSVLDPKPGDVYWTIADDQTVGPNNIPFLTFRCPECVWENDIVGHTVTITATGIPTVKGVIACINCDWVGKITKGEFT